MGALFSNILSLFSKLLSNPRVNILILGLDSAGKTSLLYRWKLNEFVSTVPTTGFNLEKTHLKNGIKCNLIDYSGQKKQRSLWRHNFYHAHALIFVIDLNDFSRMEEARKELYFVLSFNEMQTIPVLIVGNKSDLRNTMTADEITDGLELRLLNDSHQWDITFCSAVTGKGMPEMMQKVTILSSQYYEIKSSGSSIH